MVTCKNVNDSVQKTLDFTLIVTMVTLVFLMMVTLVFRPRTDYEKRVRAQARAMTVPE